MKGRLGKRSHLSSPTCILRKPWSKSVRMGLSLPCARAAGPTTGVTVTPKGTLDDFGWRLLGCDLCHLEPLPSFATSSG